MAEILIKSPITTNGRDPKMSADGKIQYKETIVQASARTTFEKLNAKLPKHLQRIITDVPVEKPAKTVKDDTGK